MKALKRHFDLGLFDDLVPLNETNDAMRAHLAQRLRVEIRGEDTVLFNKGDTGRYSVCLLEGEVALTSPLSPEERIRADTAAARYPLAHHFPRHVTARALTRTKLLIIDGDVAELIDAAAAQPAEQTDWKTAWLKSPLFQRMPRPHLDDLLEHMEEIAVQAGQVILHQDEVADCYYVIKKGRCSVSRRPAPRARDVKLAELETGQGFGDAAVILLQHGLDAYVLKGGVSGAPKHRIKHTRAFRQEDPHAEQGTHTVVRFPDAAGRDSGEPAGKFDWVSDEAMWRNTIGLRHAQGLESLFTPTDMYRNQAVDTSHQGFEDVRLFTKVGDGTGAHHSLAEDEANGSVQTYTQRRADPTAARAQQGDQFTFGRRSARAGGRPAYAQSDVAPPRGLGKVGIVALALLMISVGFATAFWTNDGLRNAVSQIPDWVQKQRDLDAKVSRLIENIETLPALQPVRAAPAPETVPSTDPRNSGEIIRTP